VIRRRTGGGMQVARRQIVRVVSALNNIYFPHLGKLLDKRNHALVAFDQTVYVYISQAVEGLKVRVSGTINLEILLGGLNLYRCLWGVLFPLHALLHSRKLPKWKI
jgi:hypothetical protein